MRLAQIKSRFIKKCSGVLAQATGTEEWIVGKVTDDNDWRPLTNDHRLYK